MSLTDEAALNQDTMLDAALRAGIDSLALNQEITFVQYRRVVLPLDGYVFWVKADLLVPNAYNMQPLNTPPLGGPSIVKGPAKEIRIKGSLHYATDQIQDEVATYASNRVIFTSESEVQDFNAVAEDLMYIGEWEGIRFAFNARGSFYRQADIFHYVGNAIYSVMEPNIIDDPMLFRNRQIVSNSLPIWMSMNGYVAEPWEFFSNNTFPMFPSFLSPGNLPPPYATIHVEPSGTLALAATPRLDRTVGHTQLCRDFVRITMYGLDNEAALTFQDFVNQFSVNTDAIGIMNIPVIRDEKQTQTELAILALKKSIEFEVSYYQNVARDLARQLIKQVIVNYEFGN